MKFACANCGQKFKVADETRTAFQFTCPACGASFKADVAEGPIIMPIAPPAQPAKPAQPAPRLTINPAAAVPAAAVPAAARPGVTVCAVHPQQPATGVCGKCNAPICNACIKQHGYFCGKACLNDMRRDIDAAEVVAKAKKERLLKAVGKTIKWVFRLAALAFAVWVGWWIWLLFFDPAGKVAWQWDKSIDAGSFHVLDHAGGKFTFINKDTVVTLDATSGAETASRSMPELANCFSGPVSALSDKILLSGKDQLAAVSRQGQFLWKTAFTGESIVQISASENFALLMLSREDEEHKKKKGQSPNYYPEYLSTLAAVKLKDGRTLWTKKLEKTAWLQKLSVGNKYFTYLAFSHGGEKDAGPALLLKLAECESGQEVWQVKLKRQPDWGPRLLNDALLFRLNDTLRALQAADGKKLWELQVKGQPHRRYWRAEENDNADAAGLAYFVGPAGLTVVDLAAGKARWNKKLPAMPAEIVNGGDRLFLRLQQQIKVDDGQKVKLPPAYEQLKKGDPVMEALQGAAKEGRYKREDTVLCLDAATGNDLWKSAQVYGDLVADAKHAMMISDTAVTSRLSAMSASSDGDAVVEQFDLGSGKRLFVRKAPVGVAGPYFICGDKVIGYKYNRRDGRPGASGSLSAFSRPKPPVYPGLVAFNLK